jgi:hypothetical protein
MPDTATPPRQHHRVPQPLATGNDPSGRQGHRTSRTSFSSTRSSTPLPSPSLVAARTYYHEYVAPIGQNFDAHQRRRTLIEGQQTPQRSSTLVTAGALATQLATFKFTPGIQNLQAVLETADIGPKFKEEEAEGDMYEIKQNDPIKDETIATHKLSNEFCDPIVDILRKVPFQYTHDHLREWGFAYLGNIATADAFVSAVSLRRPSLALVKEESVQIKSESLGMVTIRARVLPRAKERHPFLIQRQFDIEDLRASIPAQKLSRTSEDIDSTRIRHSSTLRRSSTQQLSLRSQQRGSADGSRGAQLEWLGKRAMPIRKYSQLRPRTHL